MSFRRAVVGIVIAVALLATGCTAETAVDPDQPTKTKTFPNVAFESVPADDVPTGGVLTLPVAVTPDDVGTWNPLHVEAQHPAIQRLLAPTLASLVTLDAEGEWQTNPDYAIAINVDTDDGLTVNVVLNPNVRWPDGSSVTAWDYRATYLAVAGSAGGFDVAPNALAAAAQVEVVSQNHLRVHWADAGAEWQALLRISPLPEEDVSTPEAFNDAYRDEPPPTLGPYAFRSAVPRAEGPLDESAAEALDALPDTELTLVPNPQWWGETPKLDAIEFRELASTAAANAFAVGEVDAVPVASASELAVARARDGAVVQRAAPEAGLFLAMNGLRAPLDDDAVRRAIAMTLDREVLARLLGEPLGVSTEPLDNWVLLPGSTGYTDASSELIVRDIIRARAVLTDAGWTVGDAGLERDGEALDLVLLVPRGTESLELQARGVQDSLAPLGIDVDIVALSDEELSVRERAGDFDLAFVSCGSAQTPIAATEPCFSPASSVLNVSGIAASGLDSLWQHARAAESEEDRATAVLAINEALATEVPSIPLAPEPAVFVVGDRVVNFGAAPLAAIDWSIVGVRN